MFDFLFNTEYSWVYYVIWVLYILTILTIVAVVLSENRNPVKTIAWITVLLFLPGIGMIFYLFFGRNPKSKRMISRHDSRKLRKHSLRNVRKINPASTLSDSALQQIELSQVLSGANLYSGNKIDIFTNAKDKFDSLLADIRNAKQYIHIQYYIFENDVIGNQVKSALIERAHNGVSIRVMYDDVGCWKVKSAFFKEMRDAGIEVHPFLKVTFPQLASRINNRNHRKVVVIDGKIGYIGGMNIADRYITGVRNGVWRDTHSRIEGPAVYGLQYSFAVDWSFISKIILSDPEYHPVLPSQGDVNIQVGTSGPIGEWNNIELVFLKAISNAKHCVYIQTPYFLPTNSLLQVVQAAALAKVDVRIMLPRMSDSKMLTWASFSYISAVLKAGAKVYLYSAGMMHSKMMIVDDEFSTLGSTNFDFRSFEHNFEANIFIYSKDINSKLKQIYFNDMKDSERMVLSQWRKRPLPEKIKESLVRIMSPIL